MRRSRVDLPEPEGPRTARNSPGVTSRVMLSRATTPLSKDRRTPVIETRVPAAGQSCMCGVFLRGAGGGSKRCMCLQSGKCNRRDAETQRQTQRSGGKSGLLVRGGRRGLASPLRGIDGGHREEAKPLPKAAAERRRYSHLNPLLWVRLRV